MSVRDEVAVKLSAYTLFCRQLLTCLPALDDALRGDLRLTCEDCCQRFSQSLHEFFQEAAPHDLEQAVERLGALLRGRVGLLEDLNPQVTVVFQQAIEAARAAVPTWRYQDDLESFHRQGWQLARCFYAGSPWPAIQSRLDREAQLVFCDEEGAEVAFRERYLDEGTDQELRGVILVRFTFDCNFDSYLAYPYIFMHEYVAHVFVPGYDNQQFNDGWLLYAADRFLTHYGWDLDIGSPLVREQIAIFGERLRHQWPPASQRGYCAAQAFDAWLGNWDRFQAMTWELAAFEPRVGESPFWPDQFINRLAQEFDHNRPLLRRKIETAHDLRALFETLPPA